MKPTKAGTTWEIVERSDGMFDVYQQITRVGGVGVTLEQAVEWCHRVSSGNCAIELKTTFFDEHESLPQE